MEETMTSKEKNGIKEKEKVQKGLHLVWLVLEAKEKLPCLK